MKYSCTRRLLFCAGHRVKGHESKCRNLHGHNYAVFVEATSASGLDRLGRVIDFAVLKERIGSWIDEHWDHGFIIWKEDTDALAALRKFAELDGTDQKVFLLDSNPTAENLAEFLLAQCRELLHDCAVEVQKVVVWETENCFAEACW